MRRASCAATCPTLLQSLLSLGSSWQDAVWFQSFESCFFFKTLFIFNGDDPFPRSIFSVLGRSQQQGKTIIKIKAKIVQFSLWKEAVPRRPARDACTQVKAGGRGVLVFLQLSRCSRGWLRRASSGWCGGCRWSGARKRGGQAPWPGPCHRVDSREESRMSS